MVCAIVKCLADPVGFDVVVCASAAEAIAGMSERPADMAFVDLLNQYRGSLGLAPVTLNSEIGAAAEALVEQLLRMRRRRLWVFESADLQVGGHACAEDRGDDDEGQRRGEDDTGVTDDSASEAPQHGAAVVSGGRTERSSTDRSMD